MLKETDRYFKRIAINKEFHEDKGLYGYLIMFDKQIGDNYTILFFEGHDYKKSLKESADVPDLIFDYMVSVLDFIVEQINEKEVNFLNFDFDYEYELEKRMKDKIKNF